MSTAPTCFHCNKQLGLTTSTTVQFRDACAHCQSDVHVCRNCTFYDTGAHHECRESSAEWVRDKERSNRCEYFRLSAASGAAASKTAALAALDDLFKK